MRLSTYSDYSIRVLLHAALRDPERVTVGEVATAFGVSSNHLVKVVHELGKNGFLATKRGVGGGFTLARAPDDITLGAIVRLGEKSETVIDCKDRQDNLCRIFPACRLKGVLKEAADAFFVVLDGYTLSDLLNQPPELKKLLRI